MPQCKGSARRFGSRKAHRRGHAVRGCKGLECGALRAFSDDGRTDALSRAVEELTPFYGADCPAAVIVRASWPDERIIRATLGTLLGELANDPPERTALILVGPVLGADDFRDSALYDANYRRRYRLGGVA